MHGFPVVLAYVASSAFWLLLYAQSKEPALLLPFVTCYGANVAIIGLIRLIARVPGIDLRSAVSIATAKGVLVVLPPVLAQSGLTIAAALDLAGCLIALYVASAVFARLQPDLGLEPIDTPRWIRQVAVVAATSSLAMGLHYGALPALDLQALIP